MHDETFADLFADLNDAREECERAFDQRLREMTDRLDGPSDWLTEREEIQLRREAPLVSMSGCRRWLDR
jgi:hypothetical protein